MDHRAHRGVSVDHAREACDLRRLPGTVARPPRTRSSGALPVGMRACGSAGEHAPAHGRPSTAPPMFERVGIPDVFALDHSGAGILRLRHHRRTDPWVLTNPSAASKSLMPTGTSHGVTPDEQRPPPVAPSLPPRVACSSRPATGTSWAGSPSAILDPLRESELHRLFIVPSQFGSNIRVLFRRRARNVADQVNQRRAVYGRETWPVSSKQRLALWCRRINGHRRPSRRSDSSHD